MEAAVRYYSRFGNTRVLAEAIAKGQGRRQCLWEKAETVLNEEVDVLFIGGALYAYGLDGNLKKYLQTLKKDQVKKAVVFSTSWLSKHSIDLIRKGLTESGISVETEYFYAKNRPSDTELKEAEAFAKRFL